MYQLYYFPNNASLAPHFLLHHLQCDYELLLVDRKNNGHKSAEYLKLNPAGRIPTLIDNGKPIFESSAICIHLCEQHPESGLMPALGDAKRADFFQWISYLNNTLQAELLVRHYPHRHTTDEAAIPSVVAAQDERIGDALKIIDEQLAKHDYLLGDTLSACDYFLFMLCRWALPCAQSPRDFPHLSQHLKALGESQTVKAVCEKEGVDPALFA